jgi:radical SAM superfamily enzyme YgiQ (UPF0313 family)
MRVLFINMSVRPDAIHKIPNVGLAYIMTATERAGFAFDFIDIDAHRYSDEQVDQLVRNQKCDVVAIGTLVSVYGRAKQLFKMVRTYHPNARIVVGNTLGTSIPRTLLSKTEADICVIGEGELTFIDLLHALEEGRSLHGVPGIAFKHNGEFVATPQRPLIPDIDEIPFPNYDLMDMGIYLESSRHVVSNPDTLPIEFDDIVAMPLSSARGCPFHCNFCYHAFQHRKYRFRSPESIVAEMRHWKEKYGTNVINFWDELTFFQIQATEKFADLLIEADLDMQWCASCRSELLVRRDGGPRVAEKLRRAGCHGMGFALESGNPEILAYMQKENTVKEFIEQCNVLHEADIDVYTSIIIGDPQESTATIDDTFEVLRQARIYPSVGFLQLMPGTPMYDLAVQRGAVTDIEDYLMKMGDRQDLRINLTQYDDKFLMDYTIEKLKELNRELGTGVNEQSLIKTKRYYAVKRKQRSKFMEGFGVAAQVADQADATDQSDLEEFKRAASDVLRTTNMTEC